MNVGDLVRYKNQHDAFRLVSHVCKGFVGLVVENVPGPMVRVKWNSKHSSLLWHRPEDLEVVNESE
jgi:hypothetical protein